MELVLTIDSQQQALSESLRLRLQVLLEHILQTQNLPADAQVSLTFTDPQEIQSLNYRFRRIDRPTDVLSFPLLSPQEIKEARAARRWLVPACAKSSNSPVLLGDIVICGPICKQQAAEYGHSEEREIAYLAAHSMLHLLGYDHETEQERQIMRALEEESLKETGFGRCLL